MNGRRYATLLQASATNPEKSDLNRTSMRSTLDSQKHFVFEAGKPARNPRGTVTCREPRNFMKSLPSATGCVNRTRRMVRTGLFFSSKLRHG